MDTVEPCRAAVGLRACGPVIFSGTFGRAADVDRELPTEFAEAELLNLSLRRPEASGGVIGRGADCREAELILDPLTDVSSCSLATGRGRAIIRDGPAVGELLFAALR